MERGVQSSGDDQFSESMTTHFRELCSSYTSSFRCLSAEDSAMSSDLQRLAAYGMIGDKPHQLLDASLVLWSTRNFSLFLDALYGVNRMIVMSLSPYVPLTSKTFPNASKRGMDACKPYFLSLRFPTPLRLACSYTSLTRVRKCFTGQGDHNIKLYL